MRLSIPWNKVPFINFEVAAGLKEFIESRCAKRGQKDFISIDTSIFTRGLPGDSSETRLAGHRRGRLPRTFCEHTWQEVLFRQYDGRRRGRPPRSTLPLPWSLRPKGPRHGRPPDNYPSLETDPVSKIFRLCVPGFCGGSSHGVKKRSAMFSLVLRY